MKIAVSRVMKKIVLGLISAFLLSACLGLLFFKFVQRNIAANMRPPHLQRQAEAAVDLTYRTLDGEARHLSSIKGQVVYLDLWGTWCVQCVAEMPTIQKLYDHYKGDSQVKFLIISRLDSPSAVRSYASRHHLDLPFYIMENQDIPEPMRLNQYPSTFLYAKDGTLVAKHVGAADWSDRSVISFIDKLGKQ